MSDQTGQPTEEEIEAYYAQLREAPVGDLLMQCIGMLAAGAEAKLGRPDARTLIDSMAAMVQLGEGKLGEATDQLKAAVAQLQTAQVQVERQLAAQGQGQDQPDGEPAGAESPPQAAAPPQGAEQQPPSRPQPKPTDKLWIPGR